LKRKKGVEEKKEKRKGMNDKNVKVDEKWNYGKNE